MEIPACVSSCRGAMERHPWRSVLCTSMLQQELQCGQRAGSAQAAVLLMGPKGCPSRSACFERFGAQCLNKRDINASTAEGRGCQARAEAQPQGRCRLLRAAGGWSGIRGAKGIMHGLSLFAEALLRATQGMLHSLLCALTHDTSPAATHIHHQPDPKHADVAEVVD